MARKSKQDWMNGAVQVLVAHGIEGMTLDALTAQMGVTKGSFYHHFADMGAFRAEMLDSCLRQSTAGVFAQVEQAGESPRARLEALTALAAQPDPVEVAVRGWARTDPAAYAMLCDIDAQRTAYIAGVLRGLGHPEAEAERRARVYYALFIGGQHLCPPMPADALHTALMAVAG
jgi:AcrR family transcriptional regulator